jgi:hypothetical protein
VTRAQPSPASGFITVRYLSAVVGLVCLAALIFLIMDLRHRVDGYRAVTGSRITGLATVTRCQWNQTGSVCRGDFVSADNRIRRAGIRVNGAATILNWTRSKGDGRPPAGTKVRAVLADPTADEAWTLDGEPWMDFSRLHVYMLIPVALGAAFGLSVVRGGVSGWRVRRYRSRWRRLRRDNRRIRHDQRRTRRGQVH